MQKQEFIEKIRAKYPIYDDMSDDELYNKWIAKFPVYANQIEPDEEPGTLSKIGSGVLEAGKKVGIGLLKAPADLYNIGNDVIGTDAKIKTVFGKDYKGGLLQNIGDRISERGEDLGGAIEQTAEAVGSGDALKQAEGAYQMGGAIAGGVFDVFGEAFMSGLKTITPDETQESIKQTIQETVQGSDTLQSVVGMMSQYEEAMNWAKVNDPASYRTQRANMAFIEGTLEVLGVKKVGDVFTATGEGVIKNTEKAQELTKDVYDKLVTGLGTVKENIGSKTKKTTEQVNEVLGGMPMTSKNYVKGLSPSGMEFEIEETPGFFDNVSDLVFKKNNDEMAVQSVFPKQTKEKGINQRLNAGKVALGGIEQLYEDRAKGIVSADIHDMGGGVEGMQEALNYWGKIIGDLTDVNETVNFRSEIDELRGAMDENFAKLNPDMYGRVRNVVDIFNSVGDEVSIKDLQNALSNIKSDVYSNFETTKQLASTSTGKALSNLLDQLQAKFDAVIDMTTGNSKELKAAKDAYRKYKLIEKDFVDSFLVSQRNAGKGLSKTAGNLGGVYELLQNPSVGGVVKGIILKQAGDMISKARSRDGNYEMLIRNLDRQSVQKYKKELDNLGTTAKNAVPDDEVVDFVREIRQTIESNMDNKQELQKIRDDLASIDDIPPKYKVVLRDVIDNYMRNADIMREEGKINAKEVMPDQYGDTLVKSFNRLQGIEKRVKSSKFDKNNQVEFQTTPAYKKFSDEAQAYIQNTNSDMTVQELYDQMKDNLGKDRFQTDTTTPQAYKNESEITSFLLKNLEGKTQVSPQFIENIGKQQGVKQAEKVIIADTLAEFSSDGKINVADFAKKFEEKLTKLDKRIMEGYEGKYSDYGNEQTPLQIAETLGENSKYTEVVYNFNDFKTDGSSHYDDDNYFGHIRNVDFDKDGETYRVVAEKQSDLFQKGGERFKNRKEQNKNFLEGQIEFFKGKLKDAKNQDEIDSINQDIKSYEESLKNANNPQEKYKFDLNIKEGHARLTREEIQRAINDGKDYLLFPKGKSAPFYEGWLKVDGVDGNMSGTNMSAEDFQNLEVGDTFEMFGETYIKLDNDPYQLNGVQEDGVMSRFDIDTGIREDIDRFIEDFKYENPDVEIGSPEFKEWVDENVPDHLKEGVLEQDQNFVDNQEWVDDLEGIYGDGKAFYNNSTGEVFILNESADPQYFEYDGMGGETMNPKDMSYEDIKEKAEDVGGSNAGGTMEYYEKILPKEVEKEAKRMGATTEDFTDDLGLDYVRVNLTNVKDKVGQAVDVFQRERSGKPIDAMEATKIVRKYLNEKQVGVDVVEKIITPEGMNAFGKYRDGLITFAENPIDTTPEHEVLHAYFDMMLNLDEKAKILSEVKKKQNLTSNIDAEEWMADNFVEFVKGRDKQSFLRKDFSDLWTNLKRIFGKGDVVENMYKDLEKLQSGVMLSNVEGLATGATGNNNEE